MKRMSVRNVTAGGAMLFVGLLVIFVLIPSGVTEPRSIKFAALSPSFYPRIVAICLCVLGAAVVLNGLIRPDPTDEQSQDAHPHAMMRTMLFFCVLGFLALTVSTLGFVLAGAIAILASMWLAGERRLWLILIIALVLPLVLHFFFLKVASIPIPGGVLDPLLRMI